MRIGIADAFGPVDQIEGKHSRKIHLLYELLNAICCLLVVFTLVSQEYTLFLAALLVFGLDQLLYRQSLIRRLHDLNVSTESVRLTLGFWPYIGLRLWHRILFEKGR